MAVLLRVDYVSVVTGGAAYYGVLAVDVVEEMKMEVEKSVVAESAGVAEVSAKSFSADP